MSSGQAHDGAEDWQQAASRVRGESSPDVEAAMVREMGGVTIEARWWASEGERLGRGPRQLVITISDEAAPGVVGRGVNSGVMRRVEPALAQMVDEWAGSASRQFDDAVDASIRDMPDTPRSRTGDYYGELLHLYEVLEATEDEPVNSLLGAMKRAGRDMNKATLNKQLQRARRRRAQG